MTVNGDEVSARKVSKILRRRQEEMLVTRLSEKKIHGVFYSQCLADGWDTANSHRWLWEGRLNSKTEGLIVAAQDGVLQTRAYQHGVEKVSVNPKCRECGEAAETIGHILSNCKQRSWFAYKTRHDKVLERVLRGLIESLKLPAPRELVEKNSGQLCPGVIETNSHTVRIDQLIPVKRAVRERRPDLAIFDKRERTITLIDVACAWEPLVRVRESEKKAKYAELAADLATQWNGWRVKRVPLVIGDLGSMAGLHEQLRQMNVWETRELNRLISDIQRETLCSSIQIIKQQ